MAHLRDAEGIKTPLPHPPYNRSKHLLLIVAGLSVSCVPQTTGLPRSQSTDTEARLHEGDTVSFAELSPPIPGTDEVIFSFDIIIGNVEKKNDVTIQCYFSSPVVNSDLGEVQLTESQPDSQNVSGTAAAFLASAEQVSKSWIDHDDLRALVRGKISGATKSSAALGGTAAALIAADAFIPLFSSIPLAGAVVGSMLAARGNLEKERPPGTQSGQWLQNGGEFIRATGIGGGVGGVVGMALTAGVPIGLMVGAAVSVKNVLTRTLALMVVSSDGKSDWIPTRALRGAALSEMKKLIREASEVNPYVFASVPNKHNVPQPRTLRCPKPAEIADILTGSRSVFAADEFASSISPSDK